MDIVVLNNLNDIAKYKVPSSHPAFNDIWNSAGTIGRLRFALDNPEYKLLKAAKIEAANVLSSRVIFNPTKTWHCCFKWYEELQKLFNRCENKI